MNNLTPEEKAVGRDNYYEAVAAADAAGDFLQFSVGGSVANGCKIEW